MAFESRSLAASILEAVAVTCSASGAGGLLVASMVPPSPEATVWRLTAGLVVLCGGGAGVVALVLSSSRRVKAGR